jgi:pyruvate formate lyase activating enzyme
MSAGWVHSWDLSTGVDGPGTRLVAFLSGCPLRCLYCQNPDTWCKHDGTRMDTAELYALMQRYHWFISCAGGGFTLSGGEPLQQPAFTRELLELASQSGLHTALDTSGFLGRKADDALLAATDLVLLDIKAGTDATHRRLTRRPLAPTLEFAERLADLAKPVWLRYVLVPGITDTPEEIERVASFAGALGNVERVDVLPFHKLGAAKYDRLGLPFPLADVPAPSAASTRETRERFADHGLCA